jgi:SAM-dependent MidA family methyltransferase
VSALAAILSRIRAHGPITLAEYMELALYDPDSGYYSSRERRSGRMGDFFTSVDVGTLFGELLAVQFEEMWRVHFRQSAQFDIVEAGAGNGRLSADILDAAKHEYPDFYAAVRLWIAERGTPARRVAARDTLVAHRERLAGCGPDIPSSVSGVIFANELLDAMPAHAVIMTAEGLREIRVGEREGKLIETLGPVSDPEIARQLSAGGMTLPEGARADISVAAARWVNAAARTLRAGFLVLIDYGHPAEELYSPQHAGGTLMTYRSHIAGSGSWLDAPGEQDLTTHVDLTAVRIAAEAAGLHTVGIIDQTYFLTSLGLADRLQTGDDRRVLARRLAAKTLLMPGGLGSAMKVMIFARMPGVPTLRGCAAGRLT